MSFGLGGPPVEPPWECQANGLTSLGSPSPCRGYNRQRLRSQVFAEFDTDSSGSIDANEVQALLVGLQLGGGGDLAVDKETIDHWFTVSVASEQQPAAVCVLFSHEGGFVEGCWAHPTPLTAGQDDNHFTGSHPLRQFGAASHFSLLPAPAPPSILPSIPLLPPGDGPRSRPAHHL